MMIINWLRQSLRKRRLSSFNRTFCPRRGSEFFAANGPNQILVNYNGAKDIDLQELYIWATPFYLNKSKDMWVIGGSLEDDMVVLCVDSKHSSVYVVRTYLCVDEMEFIRIEETLDAFLARLARVEPSRTRSKSDAASPPP